MVYEHAYLNKLMLLHSRIMLSVVNMPLKWDVGGRTLDMEITLLIMENHGIIF